MFCAILNTAYSQVARQWVSRYNGTANSVDNGRSVAVDRFGNSYLCGSVIRQGRTQSDMILLKYNSAGDTVWTRVLSGPGDQLDVATDISVDTSGNIYLTGSQTNNSGNLDILTCKFSPSGNQLWAKVYGGLTGYDVPLKISVDVSGNSFVSGRSEGTGTGYDVVTIKYNSSGDSVWVKRQNGTLNMDDNFGDHVIDAQGNFYLTCGLRITGGGTCFTTVKYSPGGIQQWLKSYSGPGNSDNPNSIALDSSGNIFVTGMSVAPLTNRDIYVIKYNSNGDSLWNRRYPGISNLWEQPSDIAVNNSGDLYITGSFSQYNGREAMGVVKYSSSGILQWSKFYLGSNIDLSSGYGSAMTLDLDGNVYVTGPFKDLEVNQTDIYTLKYNSVGTLLVFEMYNGTGSSYDQPGGIAVNNQKEIFVAGSSTGTGSGYDIVLLKYIQPPHYAPNSLTATAVSNSRINLVWSDINTNETGFKIERSSNGGVNWILRDSVAADTLHYSDLGLAANTIYSYRIYAYSQQGQSVYSFVAYDTTFNSVSAPTGLVANAVAQNKINLIWLDVNTNETGFKIERSTNAGANWILKDSVTANVLAYSDSLLSPNTIYHYRVYAFNGAGNSGYSNTSFDTTFAVTGIVLSTEIPTVYKLYDNYPNPFNPVTTILFHIPLSRGVSEGRGVLTSLVVYDLLGREVKTLIKQNLQPGKYTVSFDGSNLASGVYFYRIESGSFTEIKKMLMIK